MKHPLILVIFYLAFLFFVACSENSVKPPAEEKLCEITDTTSHDFTWATDILGVFPSVLYDVDAIDENNVWVVGAIELPEPDTVYNRETTKHNAVKWNGNKYEYFQIRVTGNEGQIGIQTLSDALPFSKENIWLFSVAGSFVHWNGNEWESAYIPERTGSIRAAWGASPDDFYLVGTNGSITHWDGAGFTLMESGTNVDLF